MGILDVALPSDDELDIPGLECPLGDVELDLPAQLLSGQNMIAVQIDGEGLDRGAKYTHARSKPSFATV